MSIPRAEKSVEQRILDITLPPNLIEQARKHRLNISRITEQALSSILDYLQAQNQSESSKFLDEPSFQKEGSCASVAQWLEQQPCKL